MATATRQSKAKKNTGPVSYYFRLRSSRGTDYSYVYTFPGPLTKEKVKEIAIAWGERTTEGTAIDAYTVTWEKVKIPPRNELLKKYHKACEIKRKAEDNCKKLAEMLNPNKVDKNSEMMMV